MIYNLIRTLLIYPIIFFVKIFSRDKKEFVEKRTCQDLSFLSKENTIWVHCSSVGEINLSQPLIQKLLSERDEQILISVFTDTGYANAKDKYKDKEKVKIIYFPLDYYWKIKKITKLINLKLLIIIETEIWPNLIKICAKKAKVIIVNGRISDRSFPKYKRMRFFLKSSLKKVKAFYMQSQEDAEKMINLGVKKEKVENAGNLKFSINFENYSEEEKESLKTKIFAGDRKIIVLGSTRELEEEKILSNIANYSNILLVITPRHLKRVESIERLLKEKKLSYHKMTEIASLDKEVNVILVNEMGSLRKFYSIADVAFVGGTLVNIGGHSLLEPLFYGKTPIFGKYTQNVKEISKDITRMQLGVQISDETEFEVEMELILKSGSKKAEIDKLFKDNKDVLDKILCNISRLI